MDKSFQEALRNRVVNNNRPSQSQIQYRNIPEEEFDSNEARRVSPQQMRSVQDTRRISPIQQKPPYNSPQQRPQAKPDENISIRDISNSITKFFVAVTDIGVALFKAILILGGIIALNAADVLMGTIALTILFGGADKSVFGIPVWQIATALSMSASAIQIYFWKILDKKKIGLKNFFQWKQLPKDVKTFLGLSIVVAVIDTFIDVSPIPIMVQNSPFQAMPILFNFMVGALVILTILVCGFSEKFTSGITDILLEADEKQKSK